MDQDEIRHFPHPLFFATGKLTLNHANQTTFVMPVLTRASTSELRKWHRVDGRIEAGHDDL
jgi:hypothetical protein